MTSETSRPVLLVPLTQPRWVAGLVFVLLSLASLALVTSALWVSVEPWIAYPLGVIPFLVHAFGQRSNINGLGGRVLVIRSDQSWHLAFFSEVTGLTDSKEVIVIQRWHHLFGLSLGLKFHYRPHNRTKTFFAVVWKQCTNAAVYREVALQAARQLEGAHCDSKGDSA